MPKLDIVALQALVEVSGEASMLQTVLSAAVGSKDSGMVEEVLGCLRNNLSESKVKTPTPSLEKPTCKHDRWQTYKVVHYST